MKISFQTDPAFLMGHFLFLRRSLLGLNPGVVIAEVNQANSFKTSEKLGQKTKTRSKFKRLGGWLLNLIIFIGLLVGLVTFAPQAYYYFFPVESIAVESDQAGTPLGGDFEQGNPVKSQDSTKDQAKTQEQDQQEQKILQYLPAKQDSLPQGNWLVIPRIGVRSQLQMTSDPHEALETGLWWVPDYGTPQDLSKPIIVAGHRFGWKWWWKSDYWKYHSFYNLPKLEPGDFVEVIADQRKWQFEIYAGEEGEKISDYSADIILYTCKFLNSPVRHFRYGRLIIPDQNSQEKL